MTTADTTPSAPRAAAPLHPAAPTDAALPGVVWLYLIALFTPFLLDLGPLSLSPVRLLLLLLTPILTLNLLIGRYGALKFPDFFFAAYLIWQAVSLSINNPDRVVENVGSTTIEFWGSYVLARAVIDRPERFAAFCRIFGLFIILSLLPGLWELRFGASPVITLFDKLPGVEGIRDILNFQRFGLHRVQVSFAHPIIYGLICSTAVSLTFIALKDDLSPMRRLWRTGLVTFATFTSLSSAALLAAMFHVFLIGWNWLFAGTRWRWWLLLGAMAALYVLIDLLSNRTPLRVFLSYATFSAQTAYTRIRIFDWGMYNVWQNPVFGLGLNDWVRPTEEGYLGSSVDNFWLLTAMRYGIPGFLAMAGGYVLLILRLSLMNFKDDARLARFRLAWVFTMVGLAFTLATVHIWDAAYAFVAFLLGSGVWLLSATPRAPETRDTPDDPPPARQNRYNRAATSTRSRAADTGDTAAARRNPAPQKSRAKRGPVYTRTPLRHRRGKPPG